MSQIHGLTSTLRSLLVCEPTLPVHWKTRNGKHFLLAGNRVMGEFRTAYDAEMCSIALNLAPVLFKKEDL